MFQCALHSMPANFGWVCFLFPFGFHRLVYNVYTVSLLVVILKQIGHDVYPRIEAIFDKIPHKKCRDDCFTKDIGMYLLQGFFGWFRSV